MKLWIDTETFSTRMLSDGTHAYSEAAEVMLVTWALGDGPVQVWDRTKDLELPFALEADIAEADEYWWQNGGSFDLVLVKNTLPELYELLPLEKWRDMMVRALAHGLPGGLDILCQIFKVSEADAKQASGRSLIHLFCKPQKDGKRATRLTHPKEWAEFIDYAKHDITAMRALDKKLPSWNYPNNKQELALWHRDLNVNLRGVQVDVELAEGALKAIDIEQKRLGRAARDQTDDALDSTNQRDKLLAHILKEYGVELPDMKKSTIERRANDQNLPPALRTLLLLRLEASMTSTAKYKSLLKGVSRDGRLRGLQQYCGAARTGRWAHRLWQPGNMPRYNEGLMAREMGVKKLDEAGIVSFSYLTQGVEAIKSGMADVVFDNVMGLSSNLIRSCIVAPADRKLVIADLSNIEGRKAAWLAGEDWKLKAFRDYDAGTGPDLYVAAIARAFNIPIASVDKLLRQLGKVLELSMQYEGGVGAFVTMAMTYKMELTTIRDAVFGALDSFPADRVRQARDWWQASVKQKRTLGLEEDVFVACDILKRGWREGTPAIAAGWKEIKNAVVEAICSPGRLVEWKRIKIQRDGNWLRCRLPSGRYLCYPSPRVSDDGQISYKGINQYSKKWEQINTYGGKFFEQFCQASARDVFAHAMPDIEEAGYQLCVGIHDEHVTETPDRPEYNADALGAIMCREKDWHKGLPLAAVGFEAYRYRKG